VRYLTVPVLVLAYLGLMVGCSDDGDGPAEQADHPRLGSSADLAERVGCEETTGLRAGGIIEGGETRRCVIDGEWPANIHAGLTPYQRAAGVRLLSMRNDPEDPFFDRDALHCPDGSAMDPVVVADDTWIVVIVDEAGADRVIDRIGGEVQPPQGPGVPISYAAPDAGFCRR
jgi:hypothetical protein